MRAPTLALLTAVAGSALLGLAPAASAGPLTFDPSSSNGGTIALDSRQSAFPVSSGQGEVYQNITIDGHSGDNVSYSGDLVVNLTNFGCPSCTNGLGQGSNGWSLFALVSISGQGNWTGHTFDATSSDMNIQLYGSTNFPFGVGFIDPASSSITVPTSGSISNLGMQGMGVLGVGSLIPGDACVDDLILSNCILLASGSSTTSGLTISDGRGSQEEFDLNALLTADTSIDVEDGFFGGSIPSGMSLTVFSSLGPGEHAIGVTDPDGNGDVSFTSCSALNDFFHDCGGQPVNWDASTDPVPEPASLGLLGVALVAFGAARRRRTLKA